MNKKYLTAILPYLFVGAGLFLFNSAWFALIGFHIAILFSLVILRPAPVNILFKSKNKKWIVANMLVCGSSGVMLYFLWDIFHIAQDLPAQLNSIGLNSSSSSWFFFIAYFSLVNPFIEEYYWRGVLGSDTKKPQPSDLIYAGYHALVLWGRVHPLAIVFALIVLTTIGWAWRQIRRAEDGLLAPVLGHLAADLSILLCVFIKTS